MSETTEQAPEAPRLLIADDDASSRRMLQSLAEGWGYQVELACDGAAALRAVVSPDAPPLALLDWTMPKFDGLRVCSFLRARRNERYVYVIVLTARNHPQAVVQALEAGADDYLAKPFGERELEVRLRAGRRIVELEERLHVAAMNDALTGLWNRGAIRQNLDQQLSRVRRDGSDFSVLAIDLDHFKQINDRFGHPAGDEVLREAARRMRACLRSYDVLGRVGGEEFLALLPGAELARALDVAERLRGSLDQEAVVTPAGLVPISASIGVASVVGPGVGSEALVQLADAALYRAKQAGRNRVEGPATKTGGG